MKHMHSQLILYKILRRTLSPTQEEAGQEQGDRGGDGNTGTADQENIVPGEEAGYSGDFQNTSQSSLHHILLLTLEESGQVQGDRGGDGESDSGQGEVVLRGEADDSGGPPMTADDRR